MSGKKNKSSTFTGTAPDNQYLIFINIAKN